MFNPIICCAVHLLLQYIQQWQCQGSVPAVGHIAPLRNSAFAEYTTLRMLFSLLSQKHKCSPVLVSLLQTSLQTVIVSFRIRFNQYSWSFVRSVHSVLNVTFQFTFLSPSISPHSLYSLCTLFHFHILSASSPYSTSH
uniref:Secreted protein n=1 Tax=Anguilla anguilla TaxID=7936 RepID=A0A0E9X6K4_ANGAN